MTIIPQKDINADELYTLYSEMTDLASDGNLELLSHFLKNKRLPTTIDNSPTDIDSFFTYACEGGHIDILHYLLTSPDVQDYKKIDINSNRNNFLKISLEYNRFHVAHYLIFEQQMTYSEKIQQDIGKYPIAQNMFEKRELEKTLHQTLSNKHIPLKGKLKI